MAPISAPPPPAKAGGNKKIIAIVIVAIIAVAALGLFLLFPQDEDDEKNGLTRDPDMEITILTDKPTYNFQENANITVTADNRMNQDFPYGEYSFDFTYINKQDYDSGSYSTTVTSENHNSRQSIETLTVAGGDLESITVSWILNTDNYKGPGQYYFVFEIRKDIGNNQFAILESVEALITITE